MIHSVTIPSGLGETGSDQHATPRAINICIPWNKFEKRYFLKKNSLPHYIRHSPSADLAIYAVIEHSKLEMIRIWRQGKNTDLCELHSCNQWWQHLLYLIKLACKPFAFSDLQVPLYVMPLIGHSIDASWNQTCFNKAGGRIASESSPSAYRKTSGSHLDWRRIVNVPPGYNRNKYSSLVQYLQKQRTESISSHCH